MYKYTMGYIYILRDMFIYIYIYAKGKGNSIIIIDSIYADYYWHGAGIKRRRDLLKHYLRF